MYDVTMDLVADWIKVVEEVFRGSDVPYTEEMSAEDMAVLYFNQTLEGTEAQTVATQTLTKLREMEATIHDHMTSIIVPDIRKRTGYEGESFHFCWVYNQGEHIVELNSEYRIPL